MVSVSICNYQLFGALYSLNIQEKRSELDIQPGRLKRFIRKLRWFFFIYLGRPRVVCLLTRNGLLRFWSKDKTTGRILHVYRNHEFAEITGIHDELARRGKLSANKYSLLDIGGYIGMSSIAFLLEKRFRQAYAFEPCPRNFKLLEENIALNNLEGQLIAFNVALSDREGSIDFELSDKNNGDNRVRGAGTVGPNAYQEAERSLIRVQSNSLDQFLVEHREIRPDSIGLIWMDIQGHEPFFFCGAKDFLMQNPGVPVYMELWPYAIRRSGADLEEFFEICEKYFTELVHGPNLGAGQTEPTSKLRQLYTKLEKISTETKDPGYGTNILLL